MPATPRKLDLTKFLRSDSKFLPEEKEHSKNNSLCMIYRSDKHFADDCLSWKLQAQVTIVDEQLVSDEELEDSPN